MTTRIPVHNDKSMTSIGLLDPALRAWRDGEISEGRLREIIHAWQRGEPWSLPA